MESNFSRLGWLRTALIVAATALPLGAGGAARAETWKFVVSGDSRSDSGVNTTVFGDVVKATLAEGAEAILVPGDLITGSSSDAALMETQLRSWRTVADPLYKAGVKVLAVQGNHETQNSSSQAVWNRVFSGAYAMPANGPSDAVGITYSLAHRNALFIGLDQKGRAVNQSWLDQQLTANRQPHVFVMGHYPAFSVNHDDCLDDSVTKRDAFWASLKKAGARAYFTGHDHFLDHMRVDDRDGNQGNDIHQYIAGGAGAGFSPDSAYDGANSGYTPVRIAHEAQYGYVLGTVTDNTVTLTWKRRASAGNFVAGDTFSYTVAASSTGSGGATGGGATGSGGANGSGGRIGTGGTVGSGGATDAGAAPGTGGNTGSGGVAGSGGSTRTDAATDTGADSGNKTGSETEPDAGLPAPTPDGVKLEGGGGCSVGRIPALAWPALVLAGALLLGLRRRKR